MRTVAIIQARMSSTRLPGKVLMDLYGKPVLQNIVERVERSKQVDNVVVATSTEKLDDKIYDFLLQQGVNCFRGSLENVLERFYMCANRFGADTIVRLTADNALVAPEVIDEAIVEYKKLEVDYLYYKMGLPLGMCIEVFSFDALNKAYNEATDRECLEHVTPYIRRNPDRFKLVNYKDESDRDYSMLRFTMDTPEDYKFVSTIYDYFARNDFSYQDVLSVLGEHPEWRKINQNIVQNELKYCGEKRT